MQSLGNAVPRLVFAVHKDVHDVQGLGDDERVDQLDGKFGEEKADQARTFELYQKLHRYFSQQATEPGRAAMKRGGFNLQPTLEVGNFLSRNQDRFTLFVPLIDATATADADWSNALRDFIEANLDADHVEIIPVALVAEALDVAGSGNALRLYQDDDAETRDGGGDADARRQDRLRRALTIEFISALDAFHTRQRDGDRQARRVRRDPLQFFLSHSKHDRLTGEFGWGLDLPSELRAFLKDTDNLNAYYDRNNLRPGPSWSVQLMESVEDSRMLVAFQSDTYSEREWCRRELTQAKSSQRPVFVIHCVERGESRTMPYIGNAPVVRIDLGELPDRFWERNDPEGLSADESRQVEAAKARFTERLPELLDHMLAEILRHAHWQATVAAAGLEERPSVEVFFQQPELLSVWFRSLHTRDQMIAVYPDPPLPPDLARILQNGAPGCSFLSFSQYRGFLRPDGSVPAFALS